MPSRRARLISCLLAGLAACAFAVDAQADPGKSKKKKKPRQRFFRVKRIKPRHGRTFVDPRSEIRVRVSRGLDLASLSSETVVVRRLLGDKVAWTPRLEKNGRLLILTPLAFLQAGKDYEVSVRFGLRTSDGRELKREKSSVFFTDPRFEPFQFLSPDQFETLSSTMLEGRAAHSATLLGDGRVLLAGGQTDFVSITTSADIFDPAENEFIPVNSLLREPRAFHPAPSVTGAAILVGGWDGVGAMSSTEIFDPTLDVFLPGPDMVEERDFVDAVALEDGRVLAVGGLSYTNTGAAVFSQSAEIFDPGAGEFRLTRTRPVKARAGHVLTLLQDGRVLITGGQPPGNGAPGSAEIFEPRTETFRETKFRPLTSRQLGSATMLETGWVLVADGGTGKVELFDPVSERFFDAGGASFVRRTRATASRLPGDRVLFAGGFDQRGEEQLILEGMDLYMPQLGGGGLGRVVRASTVFEEPRAGHTATVLTDSRVLFAGGFGSTSDFSLFTGVIFTPSQ